MGVKKSTKRVREENSDSTTLCTQFEKTGMSSKPWQRIPRNQITTESWVRFPGPISGDRNISRFDHYPGSLRTGCVCDIRVSTLVLELTTWAPHPKWDLDISYLRREESWPPHLGFPKREWWWSVGSQCIGASPNTKWQVGTEISAA